MRIVYLPSADRDLVDIHTYVSFYNEHDADEQIDRIKVVIMRLRDYPSSAPARPAIGEEARGLSVDSYVALYRVTDDSVEIVRVVHSARDMRGFAPDFSSRD